MECLQSDPIQKQILVKKVTVAFPKFSSKAHLFLLIGWPKYYHSLYLIISLESTVGNIASQEKSVLLQIIELPSHWKHTIHVGQRLAPTEEMLTLHFCSFQILRSLVILSKGEGKETLWFLLSKSLSLCRLFSIHDCHQPQVKFS